MNIPIDIKKLYEKEHSWADEANRELSGKTDFLFAVSSNGWTGQDAYCYEEFMQSGSLVTYLLVAEQCRRNGITHVYDIGCCTALQAKIFQSMGIQYTGIECDKTCLLNAPQGEGIEYINSVYPFPIKVEDKEHTAVVSNLCLGFLIKPAEKAYEQLSEDFRFFCGDIGPNGFSSFISRFGITDGLNGKDVGLTGENASIFVLWADRERVHDINEKVQQNKLDYFQRIFSYSPECLLKDKDVKENGKNGMKPKKKLFRSKDSSAKNRDDVSNGFEL